MFSCSVLRRSAIALTLFSGVLLLVPASLAAAQAAAALQPVAQMDRIPARPDFAPLTQLTGQLPGWVQDRPQSSARAADLSATIQVALILRRDATVQAAFEKLLADQQNPASPMYHQWLTPQQLGHLYGPTANDLAALTSWLTSQGLKVDSTSPSGVIVRASGTAAVLGNAFHTSFAMFNPDEGLTAAPRLSAVSEPSVPSVLTPLIRSIHGLGDLHVAPLIRGKVVQGSLDRRPSAALSASPLFTLSSGDHFLSPGDFATIYDLNNVYTAGNKGATIGLNTQRIAVLGESAVTDSDISIFETDTGLPAVTPNVVVPPGAVSPGITGDSAQDEATLDVDRVIATAPGAAVDLIIAENTNTQDGIFIAALYNVDTLLDPVMTISFGGCEASAGLSGVDYVDTFATNGAAEGITTLVASGDSGAAGCDTSFKAPPASQVASINFICSSQYVTCVGGTEFNDIASPSTYWASSNSATLVSALSYIPEGAWNEPTVVTNGVTTYQAAASGGGVSKFIPKPTWQTGTGVPADNFRDVPDVSFPAAEHDGYFACLAYNGGNCANNYFEDFFGTSAAAPGMAGVVALLNEQLGTSQGNINPLLYGLAKSTPTAFHDATITTSGVSNCSSATPSMCNNSTPSPSALTGGLAGYDLTTGFDLSTGLGSIDVANLLAGAVTATSLTSTNLVITPPAAITAGQSTTFTATLTPATGSTGTPTGTVQFYSNGSALGSAVTLTANSATSAAQTFATAGSFSITAVYSGDSSFATSTAPPVTLTVNAVVVGNFTLAASAFTPSSVTPITSTNGITNTGTATSTITATSTGGFAGSVAFTCAVTPATGAPPACAVAPTSVTLAANGTASTTLTITYSGPTSDCVTNAGSKPVSIHVAYFGPAAFALLLLLLPFRKRKSLRNLACIVLLVSGMASLSGCSGNSTTGGGVCSNAISGGTSAGTYTVTVTGKSGSLTQTAMASITVNAAN
jgi:subtilase family serine protease